MSSENQHPDTQPEQSLPPGVFVFATKDGNGNTVIDYRVDDGVDLLSVESLLELGAVKARADLGMPPRR